MDIHEHARKGTLVGAVLNDHVKKNPNLLNELDPKTGWTPLAAATVKEHVEVVEQLLKKCARADLRSKNGETPLLLATRNPIINHADKNTPLMFATKQKDLESIRLLRNAGACPMRRNNDGFSAKDLAEQTEDKAVQRALYLDKDQSDLFKLVKLVLDLLLFVITWVNQVTGAICRMYKLDTEMYQFTREASTRTSINITNEGHSANGESQLVISPICEPNRCPNQVNAKSPCYLPDDDMCVGEGSPPDDEFQELSVKVDRIVKETALERFFERKENYMKEVIQKAVHLKNDKSTSLGGDGLLHKTIKVSLHQQVVYCDDSSSMRGSLNGESQKTLWDCQKDLVKRITQITTLILPEGHKLAGMEPVPTNDSHTKIGTSLKSKVLKPLVYDRLKAEGLERPLLISVITDGRPNGENQSELVNAILECGKELEDAGYHREDVKFVIGQIGAANAAAEFLDTIRGNAEIRRVVYCTTDRLDEKFAEFRENKEGLDQWLIDTLYKPIMNLEQ
ncbi:uncharacterized protein LTHEOB_11048 [Lasiodiplodia theobromae]|uniref:uncharacterized protein n=1 Tax=Lasiodiplodia theobromae TaxID=45133 RepID=UPI0015C3BB8D|nr:uncharacterized protein LTHEOB_11048 [Lasiodiplodia theobromae]KAF4538100.1 hypothetical protein LTHEOB_11048 [Lasiodiplodia theobromae]